MNALDVTYHGGQRFQFARCQLLCIFGAWLLGVAGAVSAPLDYAGQLAAKLEPTRKLVYKSVDGRDLQLHIFQPDGFKASDQRPCFVTVHGGGWIWGEPRRMYPLAAHYAAQGWVGMSIEYRLIRSAPGLTPMDCAKDGRSAIRYIRGHAAELGIDPQKIVVNGGSAGAHVAAGSALFDGVDEAGEDVSVSSAANALVLFFPVIDTSTEGFGNKECGADWQKISPLHNVKRGLPPTLIFHGTADEICPYKGAVAFRDAAIAAGNRCDLVSAEGAPHTYLLREKTVYEEAIKKTDEFLIEIGLLKLDSAAGVGR